MWPVAVAVLPGAEGTGPMAKWTQCLGALVGPGGMRRPPVRTGLHPEKPKIEVRWLYIPADDLSHAKPRHG